MPHKHIVKSYDRELEQLQQKILDMGQLTGEQLTTAFRAFRLRDVQRAEEVVNNDAAIDRLEQEIHHFVVHLLASRQPLATDLRTITTALQLATDIERIADYAENIARHVLKMTKMDIPESLSASILDMSALAHEMFQGILEAYQQTNPQQAQKVKERDRDIDQRYANLLKQLQVSMKSDAHNVDACTSLLFIARCLERIGDHIKNVAEHIHFIVTGEL